MSRIQKCCNLLAGIVTCSVLGLSPARQVSAQVLVPSTVPTVEEITWDQAVRNFRERNKLVGTVVIGTERWTPERQAAEPTAFREALMEAQARVASPRYQAARKAELDRVNESTKAYRERRLEEDTLDRQERLARLNFDWQRISGWQLADNAVAVRIAELDAQATANALALQSPKVSVVQSPGAATPAAAPVVAVPVQPTGLEITPEVKARAIRRFLTGGESMTQIALDSNVPPQLVQQWVREILK